MHAAAARLAPPVDRPTVQVWDPLVRIFHWTAVVAFLIAYFSSGVIMALHAWAGYVIVGLVVMRVAWGLVGPQHARFSDFVFGPVAVWRYVGDLVRFRAPRHIGHSPAGGAMVIALLLGLAATTATGLTFYAVDKHAGPLAVFMSPMAPSAAATAAEESVPAPGQRRREESTLRDVHQLLGNAVLGLVILHVAGVVLASVVHRENLARAMITGRKPIE